MGKSKQQDETARDVILLRVFVGQEELEHHAFTKDKIVIGRDPYADIYLEDAKISRVHATIEREGNSRLFRDHSTNGALINGARVRTHTIRQSDEVTIGRFRIAIEIHPQSETSFFDASRAEGLGVDVEQTLRAPTERGSESLAGVKTPSSSRAPRA
jgi:pSer/pThr/pTyr-binding forkhead associated (FHA) protein